MNNHLNSKIQKVILLLGPPGSGKGTQAVRLSKELQIPHISTGELLRDHLNRNTPLGKQMRSYMDKGLLGPDDLVLEMLFDRLARPDCAQGYLLDGFPRTLNQAKALDGHLDDGINLIALNLDVSDEVIFKRMAGRLTCKRCGNVHNQYFSPPTIQGQCDKCQGELYQRSDDSPEVVKERLKVYQKQTLPLIDFYEKKGVLFHINGEQPPEEVFNNLMRAI